MPKLKVEFTVEGLREQLKNNAVYGDAVEALQFLMKEYDSKNAYAKWQDGFIKHLQEMNEEFHVLFRATFLETISENG